MGAHNKSIDTTANDSVPGPLPTTPQPLQPEPFPSIPDWWRCLRIGAVSGRYQGDMVEPKAGAFELDLRVDIDPRYANSPVMERVSGDCYQVFRLLLPGRPPIRWRVYQYSWIIDAPQVTWYRCRVEISGKVRFWSAGHPATTAAITIPWSTFAPAGPASVTLTETGGAATSYTCARKSDCFRDLVVEADVCQSVNVAPLLPSYDTHSHTIRPADLPRRTLALEEAYRETGIGVTINPTHTVIDDSAAGFATWSPAELHDVMEVHFSQISGGWPKWHLWGLLAGTFENAGTGGIMFDAAAIYGGAGEPPDRQGFAVFRNHPWFTHLPAGAPANQDEAWALRHYLYTWVHEAGHAFNLLHSWNKARPDSLSWMNYDWKYDLRNGADSFWSNFRFRFDDEELIHIRHGDRAAVIMGGDAWASGGHMEAFAASEMLAEGQVPIELLIRSKGYFNLMEPVRIELRLRNLLPDLPLTVDTRLHPDLGGVLIFIRRPDGRTLTYAPIMCQLGLPVLQTLQPFGQGAEGADRYSELIPLSYGANGFYFDQPGDYLVRAVYQGAGDVLITSNVHRLRIGIPQSQAEDRIAQDVFTYKVGMSLYLNGSRSPFLKEGRETLEALVERFPKSALGAKVSEVLAEGVSRPFYRMPASTEPVLKKAFSAEPERALELSNVARTFYQDQPDKAHNLAYHAVVRARAELLVETGQTPTAKKEVGSLIKDLDKRGVNQTVLDEIKAFQESL